MKAERSISVDHWLTVKSTIVLVPVATLLMLTAHARSFSGSFRFVFVFAAVSCAVTVDPSAQIATRAPASAAAGRIFFMRFLQSFHSVGKKARLDVSSIFSAIGGNRPSS